MSAQPNSNMFVPAAPEARAIAEAFTLSLIVCAVIFVFVVGIVGYALIKNRAKPGTGEPPQVYGNHKLEVTLTVIPFLICVALFIVSWRTANAAAPDPGDAEPDVIARGHQWWWEFEYPKENFRAAYEMHLPLGRPALVRVESFDVIHDFWVPALTRKIDAIPGHPNHVTITPEQLGRFEGTCAEFCGTQHAWMRFQVVVDSPADYATWVAAQRRPAAVPTTPIQLQGYELFSKYTCGNCHSIAGTPFDSARIAPDLTHIGSRAALGGGLIPQNLYTIMAWMGGTQAIKPGCHMPTFPLTNAELAAIANYLGALQ